MPTSTGTPSAGGGGDHAYALGHTPSELQRLKLQNQWLGEPTLEVLVRAGIGPGMRVLDLGTGVGDVAQLVASLVGESGSVLGIDRAPASIEMATQRAREAGLTNLTFKVGAVDDLDVEGQFDAVVGRLVLMYVADPTAALASITRRFLKPGGIVAFVEFDLEAIREVPAVPMVTNSRAWILETFRRNGHSTTLGPQLPQIFRAAGLPDPQTLGRVIAQPAPAVECTGHIVAVIRSLLPLIEKLGVARADEVQIDTLAERMQQALLAANASLIMPTIMGAWTRVPG